MKKQIWLREDQTELVIACLEFCKDQLNDGLCGKAHAMAGRFMYHRIDDVLALLKSADHDR